MRTTHDKTLDTVRSALVRMGTATVGDLEKRTGLAYNTVKTTLLAIGATPRAGTWPRVWGFEQTHKSLTTVTAPQLRGAEKDLNIIVSIDSYTDWAARWEAARKQFGQDVAMQAIVPDADPAKLAAELALGAQSLAGLAYALQQVADRPDWFQMLGGDIEGNL